jgi:hypothetical protein
MGKVGGVGELESCALSRFLAQCGKYFDRVVFVSGRGRHRVVAAPARNSQCAILTMMLSG